MMCVNVFYITGNEISAGSDPQKINLPIEHIVKVAHVGKVMSIDMTLPKWAIFTMGVYGKILGLLSDPAEISFLTT